MKLIESYFIIESDCDGSQILKKIEKAGRTAYKSEKKITELSAPKFVKMLIEKGHLSVIEHYFITVRVVCDRGVSHEIVRHRLASYTQESTRFCNYSQGDFGKEITFIKPNFWNSNSEKDREKFDVWERTMQTIENAYMELLKMDAAPEEARSVLPNSLKTELVITMNLREWRHFFTLRTSPSAHCQMREIAVPMLEKFKVLVPIIFDDIIV